MHVEPGTTDVFVSLFCRDADGDELQSKVAADFALWFSRPGAIDVAIPLTDMTALTDAHTDGNIKFVRGCQYRLAAPDAAFAVGATEVTINGTVDGGYVLPYPIDLSATTGTGPYACTWTVNDGATALEGAVVSFWLAGVERGRATTIAGGVCTMSLPAGTYTVTIALAGYTFANATYVVSATASTWTHTFSMTAVTISAPTDAGTATGRLDMHAKDTTTGKYVSIWVRQTTRRSTTGHGDSKEWRELVSNALGVIEAPFWKSQAYEAKRGPDGTPVAFTVGTDDTFYLPSILGEP